MSVGAQQLLRSIQAAHAITKSDIENKHIRLKLTILVDRFCRIVGLSDYLDPVAGQGHRKPGAQKRVIVGEKYSSCFGRLQWILASSNEQWKLVHSIVAQVYHVLALNMLK